jgi:integrase/recombinase XerD
MFEKLFTYQAALRRHGEGPLARDRVIYLEGLAAKGMARETLLWRARCSLRVAQTIERWPAAHLFTATEIDKLAERWAAKSVARRRAKGPKWPAELFRFGAIDFFGAIGRLQVRPLPARTRYDEQIAEFIEAQRQGHWQSEVTCQAGRWHVERFLKYLEHRRVALADVDAGHVDAFFQRMAARWCRVSLRTSAKLLRRWFAYCESREWVRAGLAAAILLPRLYRDEGLPLGPTWDEVGRMLVTAAGDEPKDIRDQAILRLLSVYGLRSGELRRLTLDDLDWQNDRIRVIRSKSLREQTLPLEPSAGNAIARYLRQVRPKSPSRIVFLTTRAPYRPLSTGGLYDVVQRRQVGFDDSLRKGRGPHGLRHACARHLVEGGLTFKEVGDHLGHRSPDATRVYAKVDLVSLRRVAMDNLGGLI